MNPCTYSISTDIASGKLNTDRLTKDIRASAITVALDSISSGGDVLTITFKADLGNTDKTLLDAIVLSHSGLTIYPAGFVSDGTQKVVISPDIDSSSTWIARPTDSNTGLAGTLTNSGLVLPDDVRWTATTGKKLEIYGTMLIITNDCPMDKELHFIGTNCGQLGNKNFDRKYLTLWDYIYGCDEYREFSDHKRLLWIYPTPIIIRNCCNAKIEVTMPNGVQTGTKAVVKLRCLSSDDTQA